MTCLKPFSSLAAAALLTAGWAGAALAEVESGSLEGQWCLSADPFIAGAVQQTIFGEMELTQTGENEFTCKLWVEDHIPMVDGDDLVIRADQTCVATREGSTLKIVSTVVRIDPPQFTYYPDDFTLEIEGPSLMTGVMHAPPDPRAVFGRCVIS